MPRLTKNRFIGMLNEEFKRLKLDGFKVVDIYSTRFRDCDYEAGAAKMIATFENVQNGRQGNFYCSYSLKEYEDSFNKGMKLTFKFKSKFQFLSELDVDVN